MAEGAQGILPHGDAVASLMAALAQLSADMEGMVASARTIREATIDGHLERLAEGCRQTEEHARALARHEEERAGIVRGWATLSAASHEPTLDAIAESLPEPEATQLRTAGARLRELAETLSSLQTGNLALLRTAADIAGSAAQWISGTLDEAQRYGPAAIGVAGAQGRLLDWQV